MKMSVLDELRKKADEKKAAEQRQADTNEQLEQIYQAKILPKIQLIFDSFQETINYLHFLEEPIQIKDYCSQYPQFGDLFQSNYRINTDGRIGFADYNRLMQVNVSFFCEAEGEFSYRLESDPLIDKEINFLQSKRLIFDWKHKSIPNGGYCTLFTIQRKIPVAFRIEVDYPHSLFKVLIRNHENFRLFTKSFTPEQVDNDFLDALLSYFLRKDNRFVTADDISPEHRKAIKAAVQKQADSYKQEYEQPLSLDDEPIVSPKKNPIKSLFAKFQKKS
jgi:hypothetical protein